MGKKLAMHGHPTRSKEAIELLEMVGGKNVYNLSGFDGYAYYVIGGCQNEIRAGEYIFGDEDMHLFTLEEFLEKYPFKMGDVIKFPNDMAEEIAEMKWDEELENIIYTSVSGCTRPCSVPKNTNKANMNMNENKVESTGFMQMGKTVAVCFNPENYENEVELQLGNYEIAVRDGKTYAVLKKPKYPNTYDECCNLMPLTDCIKMPRMLHRAHALLLENFSKLLSCRDAYWKIAGEEMGLDKPWEPDWTSGKPFHCISVSGNIIGKGKWYTDNKILAFPTEEMRDAFFENFKDLIEQCKELL